LDSPIKQLYEYFEKEIFYKEKEQLIKMIKSHLSEADYYIKTLNKVVASLAQIVKQAKQKIKLPFHKK
jgi:hypothetical protein